MDAQRNAKAEFVAPIGPKGEKCPLTDAFRADGRIERLEIADHVVAGVAADDKQVAAVVAVPTKGSFPAQWKVSTASVMVTSAL
jgi:hypothetical protein